MTFIEICEWYLTKGIIKFIEFPILFLLLWFIIKKKSLLIYSILLILQWYSKYYQVDGEVTQHLSPFEQNIVSPMFKDAHNKTYHKLSELIWEMGPGLAFGLGIYFWGNYEHERQAFHHRC